MNCIVQTNKVILMSQTSLLYPVIVMLYCTCKYLSTLKSGTHTRIYCKGSWTNT